MRYTLLILMAVFITGCSESKEHKNFVKKHGSNTRIFCDKKGFTMKEAFLSPGATAPLLFLLPDGNCSYRLNTP